MRLNIKKSILALAVVSCSFSAASEDIMDIYKEAYLRDPVILEAKAQRDTAFEKISEATAALLPQINVIGTAGTTHTSVNRLTNERQNNNSYSGSVNLSQALWRHAAWKQRTIAEKNAAMQDLVYNDALQALIIRVSNAYFGVLNAADTLKYSKANQEALYRQLQEASRRFQVGLTAETDQLEAQAAYDLATTQVITAENNLANSYSEIRKLIGRDVRNIEKLNATKFSPAQMTASLDQVVKNAQDNNLSLQASVIARDIAKEQIVLAASGHEPTLDLTGSLSTSYTDFNKEIAGTAQMDGNSNQGSVGVTLNIPIFSGGATSSQVSQAEHQYVAASERLEMTHRNVVANINTGYNNVNAFVSSVRAYEQSTKSAQSALDATISGYEVGTRTITDVLTATQNLYNAMQNLSAARHNYIISRLNLLYNQGSLTVGDLESVNKGLE